MSYIDILYGKFIASEAGNPAVINARNTLTINTAVNKVSFDTTTVPSWNFTFCKDLFTLNPTRFFKGRDQLRVLSFGIMLPYGIEFADTVFTFEILKSGYTGVVFDSNIPFTTFNDITGFSSITVPFSNYEMAIDSVVPFELQTPGSPTTFMWESISGRVAAGNASMVGMNSALNTAVITPIPFIKVMHSLPMYNTLV